MSELIYNKVIYKDNDGIGLLPLYSNEHSLIYMEVLLIVPKNNPLKKYLSFTQKFSYNSSGIIKDNYEKYPIIDFLKEQEKYVLINTLDIINYTINKRTELKPFKDKLIFLIKLILN